MNKQRCTMFHASSLTSVTIVNAKEILHHANLSFKFNLFQRISMFKFLFFAIFEVIHKEGFDCHVST